MSGSGRIVIAGRYELLEVAGSGGMAAVWRGVMREGDHQVPVAIKRILSHIARDSYRCWMMEKTMRATIIW